MATYRFSAAAGAALPEGGPTAAAIEGWLQTLGLARQGLRVTRHDDAATLEGKVPDDAMRERVLLAVGNIHGIGRVEDHLMVERQRDLFDPAGSPAPGSASPRAAGLATSLDRNAVLGPGGSTLHQVQPGETLAAIAAHRYGDTAAAGYILEANAEMLGDEHGLQPGVVLRLPPR